MTIDRRRYLYSVPEQYDPLEKGFIAYDIDAVYQSISNILGTSKGTRLFLSNFGSSITTLLFEPMSDLTTTLLYDEVVRAIEAWDPRINILYNESEVIPVYDENKYEIKLVFEIRGLEDQQFEYIGTLEE